LEIILDVYHNSGARGRSEREAAAVATVLVRPVLGSVY
jgi:hypothetical protein